MKRKETIVGLDYVDDEMNPCQICGTIPTREQDALGYMQTFCPKCYRFRGIGFPKQVAADLNWNRSNPPRRK